MEKLIEVKVTWVDAWGDDGHFEIGVGSQLPDVTRCNKGFVIHEDDKDMVITQGTIDNPWAGKTFADGFVKIPKSMITDIQVDDEHGT